MRIPLSRVRLAAVCIVLCAGSYIADASTAQCRVDVCSLVVGVPPADVVERLGLSDFYKKYVNLRGFAIVSSQKVPDYALLEAAYIVNEMLSDRQDILDALITNKVRLAVMAYDELTTDIPEHSDLKPARFWDKRARGLGPTHRRPAVSCAEENMLCYPGDPYYKENILIHEFAHAIHQMGLDSVDKTFDERLRKAYDEAMEKGLWKGTYAGGNPSEYWAEGVQDFFNDNRENDSEHNHVNTRKELFEYDPQLAGLIEEVFGDKQWEYKKPMLRETQGRKHLAGYDAAKAPHFSWPEGLVEWYNKYEAERRAGKQ